VAALELDTPLTLRALIFLALAYAAEYAMLGMLEDAIIYVKIATVICATAGVILMQYEDSLRRRANWLFYSALSFTAMIWIAFVVYAFIAYQHRNLTLQELKHIYVESGELVNREIPGITTISNTFDKAELAKYKSDFDKWEMSARRFIKDRLGDAAEERFLDRSNITSLLSGTEPVKHPNIVR
jgi:predicted PurR-regulated permease PerM